jgi:hypothetical protein
MSPYRIVVVLTVLAFAAGSRSAWSTAVGAAQADPIHSEHIQLTPAVSDLQGEGAREGADVDHPTTDLFGNEVDEAVGDYRVDTRGDIYERHSPETEVPRLGPPIL